MSVDCSKAIEKRAEIKGMMKFTENKKSIFVKIFFSEFAEIRYFRINLENLPAFLKLKIHHEVSKACSESYQFSKNPI